MLVARKLMTLTFSQYLQEIPKEEGKEGSGKVVGKKVELYHSLKDHPLWKYP